MNNNHIKLFFFFLLLFGMSLDARKRKKEFIEQCCIDTAIEVPDNFGKTHFILGYPFEQIEKDRIKKKEESVCADSFGLLCEGKVRQVFFAPDDSIQQLLLYLIKEEKKSIRLAAYSFTDADVAQALIDAMHRGVSIELIVDPGCILDKFGKVRDLREKGITIFIYDPNHNKKNKNSFITSIMHNKFILFERNLLDKTLIWTGSFNFTKSAHLRNQENVIVFEDDQMMVKYAQQFDRLKTRAHAPKKKKSTAVANKRNRKGTVLEDVPAFA